MSDHTGTIPAAPNTIDLRPLSERVPALAALLKDIPGLDREMQNLSDKNAKDMAANYLKKIQSVQAIMDRDNGVDENTRLSAQQQHTLFCIARDICEAVIKIGIANLPEIPLPTQIRESLKELDRRRNSHLYKLGIWAQELKSESIKKSQTNAIDQSAIDSMLGRSSGITI